MFRGPQNPRGSFRGLCVGFVLGIILLLHQSGCTLDYILFFSSAGRWTGHCWTLWKSYEINGALQSYPEPYGL